MNRTFSYSNDTLKTSSIKKVFSNDLNRDLGFPKNYVKAYRYGFQNQEKDNELYGDNNSVNFAYRMHDTRLGRFMSVDPLATKYPSWSPYVFSGNVVINSREFEGLEPKGSYSSLTNYAPNLVGIPYDSDHNLSSLRTKLATPIESIVALDCYGSVIFVMMKANEVVAQYLIELDDKTKNEKGNMASPAYAQSAFRTKSEFHATLSGKELPNVIKGDVIYQDHSSSLDHACIVDDSPVISDDGNSLTVNVWTTNASFPNDYGISSYAYTKRANGEWYHRNMDSRKVFFIWRIDELAIVKDSYNKEMQKYGPIEKVGSKRVDSITSNNGTVSVETSTKESVNEE